MSLLEQVKELPAYQGARARRRWCEFQEPYHHLVSQGYPKVEACRVIGKIANLNEEEVKHLHWASKSWRKPTT